MSWIPQHFDESQLLSGDEFSEIAYELVGEEVQRLSVVNSLPALLQGSDGPLCMQRIVPKILLALDKASKEFHVAAALTFYTILEKKLVHPKTYAETFLRSMVEHIDFKVPEVAAIWLDVLLDAIALLPIDAIRAEVLPVAINKGQISQPVSSRIKSCRLLGKASLRLDMFYLKKELLPVILSLCQDVNHEVRACICTELSNIVKALDADVSKTMLLPSLVELASDEEALVRISAVSTIVEVLGYLTPDYMAPNEKQWILHFYQDMAQLGTLVKDTRKTFPMPDFNMSGNADRLILCRQNCAYNFPAMAIFCANLGDAYSDQLYTTFCALTSDPYFMVRRTIACGFHEVTHVLGPNCGKLKRELVKLLRDDVEEVLQGLIPHLSKTMELLAKYRELGPENMDPQSMEIGRAVLKCEAEISETHNWRLHSMLMSQLECLPLCLPSEFLHNYFIPIIFSRIHKSRAVPCRIAAARTLLVFLRYNPKAPQRNDLRTRIVNEDKVANVRMQVAGYFPRLKAMLRLPSDKKLQVALESSVRRMAANETDRDVRSMLVASMEKMDRMPIRDESISPAQLTKDDLDDQRKAEEENRLAALKVEGARRRNEVPVPPSRVPPVAPVPGGIKKGSGKAAEYRAAAPRGRLSGGTPTTVDEFYVDAGIRIPQQLAASGDLPTFPSRIPNLREILFKNHSMNGHSGNSNTHYITAMATTPKTSLIVPSNILEEEKFSMTSASPTLLSSSSSSPSSSSSSAATTASFPQSTASAAVASSSSSSASVSSTLVPSSMSQTFNSSTNKAGTSEPKMRIKQNISSGVVDRNATVKNTGQSGNIIPKGSVLSSSTRQNTDTYLCNKVDHSRPSSSKSRLGTIESKQKDSSVVSRRHSYMDGDKAIKTSVLISKTDNPSARKGGINSGNRRHSYIEKASIDEGKNNKSAFVVKRSYLGTTNATRYSYMEMEHSTGGSKLKSDVTLRKTAIPSRRSDNENRNSEGPNKRRSLIYMPQQNNSRINSFERRSEFEINAGVEDRQSSQIPKHPQSLAVESKRRHSSLERDDLEKLKTPSYEQSHKNSSVHVRSLRASLESINSPKSLEFEKKTQAPYNMNTNNVDKVNLRKEGKPVEEKVGYSTSDENLDLMIRKRNRLSLSKIPRGPASCHSSPGGSRASSPTNSFSNGIVRTRQRTAPNSRSTSPTGGISTSGNVRRTQRLSLGSLNSYMSNLKLNESSSRLPISILQLLRVNSITLKTYYLMLSHSFHVKETKGAKIRFPEKTFVFFHFEFEKSNEKWLHYTKTLAIFIA
ncbi:Protein piwi [Gryllus bimaculatus]|nr:Protein piwi [Gryllus bimaculatus]